MAEKLKVFKNVNAVNSGATTTIPILTTTATSQAVVKNIQYTVSDPDYPVTGSIVQDGLALNTGTQASKGTEATDVLGGSQIVDSSSTLNFVVDYEAGNFIGNQDARLFNYNSGLYKIVNTDTTERVSANHADVESSFQITALATGNFGAGTSTSAFGWLDGTTKKYSTCDSTYVRTYNEAGTLLQTAQAWIGTCYGACTDGTYFYGIKGTGQTQDLERRRVSDGSVASTITMSQSIWGQGNNRGSFMLYYDGYVYVKQNGSATYHYKIDVTTGVATQISKSEFYVGSYSAGALITVADDGYPYLLELGSDSYMYVYNLVTDVVYRFIHDSLSVSSEYGNKALEVAPGVVQFHYGSYHMWIDVNRVVAGEPTTSSAKLANTTFGDGVPVLDNQSSIANIPLHQIPGNKLPANITYSLYADGVEITGV
jgi:hypothetical protein